MDSNINKVTPKENELQNLKSKINEKSIDDYEKIEHFLKPLQSNNVNIVNNERMRRIYLKRVYLYTKKRYIDDTEKIDRMLANITDEYHKSRLNEIKKKIGIIQVLDEFNRDEKDLIEEYEKESRKLISEIQEASLASHKC